MKILSHSDVFGHIVATERITSSKLIGSYGTPRWHVTLDNGVTYRTAKNASLGYGITNSEYRDTMHRFTLDRWGNLAYVSSE